ncbi:MAG: NusG domain II-containing protein [Candidatus Faecousia sp.]|nr:NusG domain II-containing protein [Candidatus Faecousia sp.]
MKTKTWILLLSGLLLISLLAGFFVLRRQPDAALAEISSGGKVVKTVNLRENQQFTITAGNGGVNVVTVQNGKIAVTEASCPDHYCMKRGFCASGTDIVCLPNKLVIHFLGAQIVDGAVG